LIATTNELDHRQRTKTTTYQQQPLYLTRKVDSRKQSAIDNKGQTTVYEDIGGSLANSKTVAINCLLK